ncbi:hypothetical protein LZ30DRAFT_582556 [Colletotrichum cereale]|nr:hypothetical protein LZ30DRAFT_582556 [Colletotrichum cereale]
MSILENKSHWRSLPGEIRLMILELITRGDPGWGACASICKEWQAVLEKEACRRLKLRASCLDDLENMVDPRRALLARHVWLNIELRPYTCRSCWATESYSWICGNNAVIRKAIAKLFSILREWPAVEGGDLALELSFQSPSDKEHYFKNLYFGSQDEGDELKLRDAGRGLPNGTTSNQYHDPKHSWFDGHQVDPPGELAILRLFEPIDISFKEDLPPVSAVTKFVLRRQCRRQFESRNLIGFDLPPQLKHISLFEETNEDYIAIVRRSPSLAQATLATVRVASPAVGESLAARSLGLDSLSATFIVEAKDFFQVCQKDWVWEHMRVLVLSSRILTHTADPTTITRLLRDAAKAALSMPSLETTVLWNGARGEACKFFYREGSDCTAIGWRGTWDFQLERDTSHAWNLGLGREMLRAWKKVADKHTRHDLRIVQDPRIMASVDSNAHAIEFLDLPPGVIDQVSCLQLRRETASGWRRG